MDLQELRKLVSKGEGQQLEFKKKVAHPEKVVREVVAFANSKGGILLVGVDDDGNLSGDRFIDEEVFILQKALDELIVPKVPHTVEIIKLNPKKGVAIFTIPPGIKKPYYVKDAEGKGKAFVRVADKSIQASKEVREIIRGQNKNRDIWFNFGEKEKVLMKHLADNPFITLKDFAALARLKKFIASKTLIRLVLANVLEVHPGEIEDRYSLKD
jgi:predicted HTH transcriptional regulator